jgi:menaquinol-cytochrome c reductase iron-sulfur subunit
MDRMPSPPQIGRRNFLLGAVAVALGAVAKLVPVASGFLVFLNPLRPKAARGVFLPVASLEALPADGVPRRFPVIADRVNAWTKTPHVSIGAVYLRRLPDHSVQAFNVTCPHAGCFVNFLPERNAFQCPCHESHFRLDGALRDATSPSPRGLDALEVNVQPSGQILVRFQNFRPGVSEKIPIP